VVVVLAGVCAIGAAAVAKRSLDARSSRVLCCTRLMIFGGRITRVLRLRRCTMSRTSLVAATLAVALSLSCFSPAALADPPSNDVVSKYDRDKDKTLDIAEVKAAAAAHFDKLDRDGDQTLESNEVKKILGPKAFKAADTDHDGTLSKDEYLALVEKLFHEADTDHDGTLTAEELKSKSGRALQRLID
jgi:hypothetical protein